MFDSTYYTYGSTGYFSKLIVDYLAGEKSLEPFYAFKPDWEGINDAIKNRSEFPVNRTLLVDQLKKSYEGLETHQRVHQNIDALLSESTFSVCTAHQPNIFTGHLYFIYKIIHAIKLSEELNATIPNKYFVPVYFMGSEDADLNELGAVTIKGKSYKWNTNQQGAVGRMMVDEELISFIDQFEKQYSNDAFGAEVTALLKKNYELGHSIEKATHQLLNELFGKFGLVVFLPDNGFYKNQCQAIFKEELISGFSQQLIDQTVQVFPDDYPIQTKGRPINLFYLKDNFRERIEKIETGYQVVNTSIRFTTEQMIEELNQYPERFSPNVILRPLLQEICLPNIAFIGGGGELAYWLELKSIFQHANVFFPVLLLRNSFTIAEKETSQLIHELDLQPHRLFLPEAELAEILIRKVSENNLDLDQQQIQLKKLYDEIALIAGAIDATLHQHVEALHHKANKRIYYLQKKMLKAEKNKHQVLLLKLKEIKSQLFPGDSLQERVNNYFDYHAKYSEGFLEELMLHSKSIDSFFCYLEEK